VKNAWCVLIPILLAGSSAACKNGAEPAGPSGQSGAPALNVRVAPVAARDVVYRVQALGSLEAEELVQVTAEVEGAVTQALFHEGDHVTAQTVLLRIDPDRYRLEAARAEATHRKAVADWQRALDDMKRREVLAQDQLVAVEELTRARQETERLAAEAAAAKAALDIALQNVRRSDVRALRAGVINTRSVDTGQFLKVGTVLATLVDIGRLRLRFKVSEAESLKSSVGQAVTFRVAALGDRDFSAEVYHVGDVADPMTRQVEILGWVKNPGVLKPGFFAEVTLAAEAHKGAIVVPEGVVQASERGFVAYVVDGGRARQRPVQIGLRTGDGTVEIVSGLKVGDLVVTEGSDRLADGIAVEAVGREPAKGAAAQQP
jgi:membrane fusion protein (multidrug efflux system)/multidrug efflux system membrane fusion protein